jgi:uncharacterized protein with HEPN domain
MESLTPSVVARVQGIQGSIASLRKLMKGRDVEDLCADAVGRPAFERFLQIVCDASRGLPENWKTGHPDIPWQELAQLGDVITTEYYRIDLGYLWCMAETALDPLEQVLDAAVASSEGRKSVQ